MKILLIQAPLGRPEGLIYPLGLATLAGALPNDNTLKVADPNHIGSPAVNAIIKAFRPAIIGVSIRNIDSQMRRDLFYYYIHLKRYLSEIRTLAPETTLIVGGSGFSLFPEKIMQENPAVDLGVYLEAEESLPELVNNLDHPETVKGVCYRENGQVKFSGDRDFPAVDSLPFPRFDLLDPRPYAANGGIGIQTKRGCPLKCAYCTYPHLNGTCYRMRPLDKVMDEIVELHERYGIRDLTFVDGVFNLPRERAVQLLEMIKTRGLELTWRGWFIEKGFDQAFAELCRETGCAEFSFSPDGYSADTLKSLGKAIQVADIHRVYSLARQISGIRVAFNFFWNPPGQTLITFLKMIWFAFKCKLTLGKKAGGIIFGSPRIEPDTPLWNRAVAEGLITKDQNLLPATVKELHGTFYSNPRTRYLDRIFAFYSWLWKVKRSLRRDRG